MNQRALLVALVAAAGCSGAGPASTEEAVFTRTIVHLQPDGTSAVTTEPITTSQQMRDGIGRSTQAIAEDSSCGGGDIWIFDQTYFAGNEICFFGGGYADLAQYARTCPVGQPCTHWNGATRSYWSGSESGDFEVVSRPPCAETFTTYEQKWVAGSCAQSSYYLYLSN
jgi:hypothetical protein